jgi:hypothetical protein
VAAVLMVAVRVVPAVAVARALLEPLIPVAAVVVLAAA